MKKGKPFLNSKKKPLVSILAIIIVFCLIFGCSQLLVGIIFFAEGREIIISLNQKSIEKQISLYFQQLELELQMVEQLQKDLITGPDVVYLNLGPYSPFETNVAIAVDRLTTQMTTIRNGNRYIESLSLHFQNPKRTLRAGSVCYARFDADHISSLQSAPGKRFKVLDGSLSMAAYPASATPENFVCCSEIVFNSDLIASELKNFLFSEDSHSILAFTEYNYSISSNPDIFDSFSDSRPMDTHPVKLNGISYMPVTYFSDFFHAKYTQLIPEEKILMEANRLFIFLWAFSASIFLLTILHFTLLYRLINRPVKELEKAIHKVQSGDFSTSLSHIGTREFFHIYGGFNEMTKSISYLIEDVYEQQMLKQKAELRQLQAQINPHFLYNSFFILKSRITAKEYEDAGHFADMLGIYFKFISKNNADSISLGEELAHARAYASIQAVRFKNRTEIRWEEIPEQFCKLQVPPLILQPILENAFKYGLEDMEFDGLLEFRSSHDSGYLHLTIEDNSESFEKNRGKIEMLQQAFSSGIGQMEPSALLNIHRRLQLFFKDPHCGLTLEQGEQGGMKVTVKIRR